VSKTLFWYIFKDLLFVFLLTSGALAGIMSFAGLLRPLTQQGLDMGQMFQMLGYFLPAMTNYSWPVAALFATTFVYGRLAADNELIAMRAAGIGWLHILFPASVLAFCIFLASLAMMLFVVPSSFLKAERVIYSNLAQLVATRIERDRRILFNAQGNDLTISARDAIVIPSDPGKPREQAVQLNNVTIVRYANKESDTEPKRPSEYYIARRATAFITMPPDDDSGRFDDGGDALLSIQLEDGARFPAEAVDDRGKTEIRTVIKQQTTPFFPLESFVRETARFMSIDRLLAIRDAPEKSKRVAKLLVSFRRLDQQRQYLDGLRAQLEERRVLVLDSNNGIVHIELPARGASVRLENEKLTVRAGTPDEPKLQFKQIEGVGPFAALAHEATFIVFPDNERGLMNTKIDLIDAVIDNRQGGYSAKQSINATYVVPMTDAIRALNDTPAAAYLQPGRLPGTGKSLFRLKGAFVRQVNHMEAELHGRFAFAISCLVLILVGAVIGTWFKSGNFVSAFALSTVPAIICLLLIMSGQHMAENVPDSIKDVSTYVNPLKVGLWTMWSGNILVMVAGLIMGLKLRAT
jgi:lipopolysaccharide export LptBFGC system permease protein LptF